MADGTCEPPRNSCPLTFSAPTQIPSKRLSADSAVEQSRTTAAIDKINGDFMFMGGSGLKHYSETTLAGPYPLHPFAQATPSLQDETGAAAGARREQS